jgi:hypothetical protein
MVGDSDLEIEITDLETMFAENPDLDEAGTVYRVAIVGSTIYYQGIPATATAIPVLYYRIPTLMVADADTPDGIPVFLQRKLLVSGASAKVFDLIEDGLEGVQVNTSIQSQMFQQAILELREYNVKRRENKSRSIWQV